MLQHLFKPVADILHSSRREMRATQMIFQNGNIVWVPNCSLVAGNNVTIRSNVFHNMLLELILQVFQACTACLEILALSVDGLFLF